MNMPFSVRIIIFIIGIILFIIVFELLRKSKFREELSIVWLFFSIFIMFGAFLDLLIDPIAKKLSIYYPPSLVFLLMFFVLIIAFLYFSVVTSNLKNEVKELTQKIALLEYELKQTKKQN